MNDINIALPDEKPSTLPVLSHYAKAVLYTDNRGINLTAMETVFGVEPRGFVRYSASMTVGLTRNGKTVPMRVQVPVVFDYAKSADPVQEAFNLAGPLLVKKSDDQVEAMAKQAFAQAMRAGAVPGIGG